MYIAHFSVGLFILSSWIPCVSPDPRCLLTNGKLPLWAKRLVSLPGDRGTYGWQSRGALLHALLSSGSLFPSLHLSFPWRTPSSFQSPLRPSFIRVTHRANTSPRASLVLSIPYGRERGRPSQAHFLVWDMDGIHISELYSILGADKCCGGKKLRRKITSIGEREQQFLG